MWNKFAGQLFIFKYVVKISSLILQGFLTSGMGQGPVLALLLAGPPLSLPNMLVIRSVICIKKTLVYIGLLIIMAILSVLGWGMIRT